MALSLTHLSRVDSSNAEFIVFERAKDNDYQHRTLASFSQPFSGPEPARSSRVCSPVHSFHRVRSQTEFGNEKRDLTLQ
jgi:hypothetical protein